MTEIKKVFGKPDQIQAVDGIDFEIASGEALGLVGESGCGKSTTGRLITRLLEPTGGKIEYNGEDITHLSNTKLRPIRSELQMIFQDPYSSLNPRHTVGTIVGTPFKISKIVPEGGTKNEYRSYWRLLA